MAGPAPLRTPDRYRRPSNPMGEASQRVGQNVTRRWRKGAARDRRQGELLLPIAGLAADAFADRYYSNRYGRATLIARDHLVSLAGDPEALHAWLDLFGIARGLDRARLTPDDLIGIFAARLLATAS